MRTLYHVFDYHATRYIIWMTIGMSSTPFACRLRRHDRRASKRHNHSLHLRFPFFASFAFFLSTVAHCAKVDAAKIYWNWSLALATFPHWQHYNAGFSEENIAHVDHRVEVALRLDDGGEVPAVHQRCLDGFPARHADFIFCLQTPLIISFSGPHHQYQTGTISYFLRNRARFQPSKVRHD